MFLHGRRVIEVAENQYRKFEIQIPKSQADLMESALSEIMTLAEDIEDLLQDSLQDLLDESVDDENVEEILQIKVIEITGG